MSPKFIVAITALFLPLAGLVLYREGFPYKQKAPSIAEDAVLKRLNIEKFDNKTRAFDFTLKDLQGRPVSLKDFRGKVVFLNFWATWCPPCGLEMPAMEDLHKDFANQGLVILAINYRERPEEIKTFFTQHHLTFTTLLDKEAEVFGLYQAWSLPTTYLISKHGEIVGKVVGYRDWHSEQAKAFFRQLLEDKA